MAARLPDSLWTGVGHLAISSPFSAKLNHRGQLGKLESSCDPRRAWDGPANCSGTAPPRRRLRPDFDRDEATKPGPIGNGQWRLRVRFMRQVPSAMAISYRRRVMRRATSIAALCAVICLLHTGVSEAQPDPSKKSPPAATPTVSKAAPSKTVPPSQPDAKPASPKPPPSKSTLPSEPAKKPVSPTAVPSASAPIATAESLQALIKARRQSQADRLKVGDVCQVKHYKKETLQGFGLAVNLEEIVKAESTSEADETTASRAVEIVELLKLLTEPGESEQTTLPERLQAAGQVTLVAVTASVPPEGAREGDRIDCEVKAFGGTSLQNGYLLTTGLSTPGPKREPPLAIAAGPIVSVSSVRSGPSKVVGGCLVEADVCDEFIRDGKVTLLLDEEHADFSVAQDIVETVNSQIGVAAGQPLAKALNRFYVEVTVPPQYVEDPVAFVTEVLALPTQIPTPDSESR